LHKRPDASIPFETRRAGEIENTTLKRVGLKYCGGCNPSFDRVEYVREIQRAAGGRIEWVTLDAGNFSSLLAVCGCDKQCVELADQGGSGVRVIRIKDDHTPPTEILSLLLE
jgi:hypothetical protein